MGRGQGIDLRAEEEAARRAARSAVGGARFAGSGSRAKHTDLLGEQALRARLHRISHEHGMAFDDEAMRLLAMGAETRMRSLLGSAVRAQQHRVHSTHQHKPPMRASGSKGAKPLWSQKITSDTAAVMAALATANREQNKAHRVARTERNARETEMARAQAAAKEREERESGSAPDTGAGASPAAPPDEPGPSRQRPSEPVFQASPTFGGPPPVPKKSKGKKAGGRDMSAEVQAKITNQTATVNAGRKRYAWEMGGGAFRPQVSSLLSGKRKKEKVEEEEKQPREEEVEAPPPPKKKRTVSAPHRRPVDVAVRGDKRARDDTALTVVDVVFALEREGSGRGMGTADEIVRRQYAKPGGPYGPWQ
ncbi:hypothetical protein CC85DRAFT_297230 [Cutaneotrichosporon oleaginosum]|uniref:Transcription initiation factor TFIID subunit 4 n=1 Tax=Cutaneotrichosporon oleaginosum TaxID=879819 RepID=A0A0J0XIY4_9TREE|nr:uncharacterized protein CC85DRAFT_297230 [Cutaneotrichosporon oleaginosum]KLT41055.1 hypothetical protein CC85DRAFT_297230 [Cutaneotrichosporon oleaginosum]TXT12147.1 hypothetical protein COLE_02557 [Cutaneotrichosporon oleaginosum]